MNRRHAIHRVLLAAGGLAAFPLRRARGDDSKEEAVKKEFLAIEGRWRAASVEIDGNRLGDDEAKKFTFEQGRDGEWELIVDGSELARGTTSVDPTQTPKTIDFVTTGGSNAGDRTYGIYEITGTTWRICNAQAGRPRPAEFSAPAGSGRMLIVFELVKD